MLSFQETEKQVGCCASSTKSNKWNWIETLETHFFIACYFKAFTKFVVRQFTNFIDENS